MAAAISGTVGLLAGNQLPPAQLTMVLFLAAAAGFVGYIDARTKLILHQHSATVALAVAGLLAVNQLTDPTGAAILWGLATAAGGYLVMAILNLTTGFASGGDMNTVPVLAAGFVVVSPLAPVLWVLLTFIISAAVSVITIIRERGSGSQQVPLAPAMALAVGPTVWLVAFVHSAVGI